MNKFNKGLVPLSGWCDSERYNTAFLSSYNNTGAIKNDVKFTWCL